MLWEGEIVLRDETNAGLVVSDRFGREVAAQLDLEEALAASRYASHPYSTHPREWPPFIEVVDTWELPPVLIERYSAAGGEGTALCGIFPEIQKNFMNSDLVNNGLLSVGNLDCGEGQAICVVGLAKSKPGVFVKAIQYLLVLATLVEAKNASDSGGLVGSTRGASA
ncbi:hypothetical protein GH714_014407 [Hevea brasiliensis]|uniref:Uncharacterized protein n=1 Tax=Hevea brasiliensis TaxID=3981 RepID=A0A6A6LQ58_HEVBR|nr:hypothetical protein GH714_014407 [Hevea brasiliensis]